MIIADWITKLRNTLPQPLIYWLLKKDTVTRVPICQDMLINNKMYLHKFIELCQQLEEFGELDVYQWLQCKDADDCSLDRIAEKVYICQNSVNMLGTYSSFYRLKQEADSIGLKPITEAITSHQIKPNQAPLYFKYAIC